MTRWENKVISKNKNQHRIQFTEGGTNDTQKPEKSSEQETKPSKESFDNVRADNKSAINSIAGSKSILSAGGGYITDEGGSKNQIKTPSSNSIWDSEKLSNMANKPDNKEKTLSEKKDISQKQAEIRQARVNEMVDNLNNSDTRKDNGVSNIGEYHESGHYRKPQRGMSIFDNEMDFSRVPEKTAGEKVSEEVNTPKEKDESWKDCKNVSSKDIVNRMFDNLK